MHFSCRLLVVMAGAITLLVSGAAAVVGDQTDPLRNTALPARSRAGGGHLQARLRSVRRDLRRPAPDLRRGSAGRGAQRLARPDRQVARDLELLLRLGYRRDRPAQRRERPGGASLPPD